MVEICAAKEGIPKIGLKQIGCLNVCIAKVSSVEVSLKEMGSTKMGSSQVSCTEIRPNVMMRLPPLVPHHHPLLENIKMFQVGHTLPSLSTSQTTVVSTSQ